ncbi:MAG: ATP-binding protein, partial [Planctomycetota bacterium]
LLRASLPTTIAIRPHLPEDLGRVLADATQLHQIVMNLGTNAAYAMRETGGELVVSLDAIDVESDLTTGQPELRPGPYLRLTIQDTGHGMAPEVVERIFDPFFTTKQVGEGTGLGLAVAHGIVSSHNGAITVRSKLGEGTTFTLYFPRLPETVEATRSVEEPVPHGKGRILFVDDELALARLGQLTLQQLGYEVTICTSSVEALEIFRARPQNFDLVITDQTMPHMTGEALSEALRRIRADIPIILCTGFSHVIDARRAKALGIDAFCMKPLTMRELGRTIQEVLAARTR